MSFRTILLRLLILPMALILGTSLIYAQKMKPPDFQVVRGSSYSFDETVNRLKEAMEAENLMIIKEINAQQMLRMVGMKTQGMKQILFFHPRYMKTIVKKNKNAGIEPPLKVLVMEKPNGKAVVKYVKPSYIFGQYKGLDRVGQDLEALVQRIVNQIE